jgi:hypothetical protein
MTDFERLVEQMREFQRLYYRTRAKSTLERCKRIEAQVDRHLEGIREQTLNFMPAPEGAPELPMKGGMSAALKGGGFQ